MGKRKALVKLVNGEEILIKRLLHFGMNDVHEEGFLYGEISPNFQSEKYGLLESKSKEIEIPSRSILYVIHLED